jgi:hypothetical protein
MLHRITDNTVVKFFIHVSVFHPCIFLCWPTLQRNVSWHLQPGRQLAQEALWFVLSPTSTASRLAIIQNRANTGFPLTLLEKVVFAASVLPSRRHKLPGQYPVLWFHVCSCCNLVAMIVGAVHEARTASFGGRVVLVGGGGASLWAEG